MNRNSMMYDGNEFPFEVAIILDEAPAPALDMYRLRIELFMAAALSNTPTRCITPFPACFFDRKTKSPDIKKLREHIATIPKLVDIEKSTLKLCTWKLLYWIFTNPLTISKVPTIRETLDDWTLQTGLNMTSVPLESLREEVSVPTLLYTVAPSHPKKAFIEGKETHGTRFGFHGSPLKNFHSIIHRGLRSALNRRSAFGVGTYLGTSFEYSNSSEFSKGTDPDRCWTNSSFPDSSLTKCVAICEFVNHPSILVEDIQGGQTFYVIEKDELIQLSHLILMQ